MADLDERLVNGVKQAMKLRGVSMRTLASLLDMPYRSLQNYLSGATRMPASVYVQICEQLGIDNQFVLQENFHLPHATMWDALWSVFGDALVELRALPDTSGLDSMELHNRKQAAASKFAQLISDAYHRYRLEDLRRLHGGRMPTIQELEARRVGKTST